MIIVIPFCIKDCRAALRNIEWIHELDGKLPFDALLSYDTDVPQLIVEEIDAAARKSFSNVIHFRYNEWKGKPNWPNPQNFAFQCLSWEIINKHKRPFLFMEPDAVPIRPKWADDIWHDYQSCGKKFMGHIVHGVINPTSLHLNGVAVYPPNLHEYSTAMMIPPDGMAWDVAGSYGSVVQNARHTNLIMNVWEIDDKNKPVTSGGIHPIFPDQKAVDDLVDFEAALFHRCKNGTLIDRLRERRKAALPTDVEIKIPAKPPVKAKAAVPAAKPVPKPKKRKAKRKRR